MKVSLFIFNHNKLRFSSRLIELYKQTAVCIFRHWVVTTATTYNYFGKENPNFNSDAIFCVRNIKGSACNGAVIYITTMSCCFLKR